jgi:hypothetical protein
MKKFFRQFLVLNVLFFLAIISSYGQEEVVTDTLSISSGEVHAIPKPEKKARKNIINFNITNPMLISDKFQLIGYERVLSNNQSITVNLGNFSLPRLLDGDIADSLNLDTESKDRGFHLSTDYRFYLNKLNRYNAPRGVYLAPYYTLNYLNRKNSWALHDYDENISTQMKFTIHTVGFELGYQFIFWDRVALDLILFGPGVGFYGIKTKLDTSLDAEDEAKIFDKINDILEERIPGYDVIIEPNEFAKRKGSFQVKSIGFRYVARLGILF